MLKLLFNILIVGTCEREALSKICDDYLIKPVASGGAKQTRIGARHELKTIIDDVYIDHDFGADAYNVEFHFLDRALTKFTKKA